MANQKKFIEYLKEEYEIGNADQLKYALSKCEDEIVCIRSAITSLYDLRAFCDNRGSCEGCIFDGDEENGCGIDGLPRGWSVPGIEDKHKEDKPKYWDDWMERLRENSTFNKHVVLEPCPPSPTKEDGFPTKEECSPSESKEMQ